ncbi:hypothetical protein D3C78_1932810 [compost metagenome]
MGQIAKQAQGDVLQANLQLLEGRAQVIKAGVTPRPFAGAGNQTHQLLEAGTAVLRQLAPEQVQ